MADESVFSGSSCDLPPVTPVPTAHMLVNPAVPDPPDDIPDCADAPLDELPPDPPCPPITLSNASIEIVPIEDPPYVLFTITRGPNCDYDFNLEIGVPDSGCPTITPITLTTKPIVFATTTPQMTYQFTKDPDNCSFDFDLDFEVPCPPITPITPTAKGVSFGTAGLTFGFTQGVDCDYDLDIDIEAPCPPIGPTTPTNIAATYGSGGLTYAFTASPGCTYTLELDIEYPCPALTPTTLTDQPVSFNADPDEGHISYYLTPGVGCTYEFVISEATIPCVAMLPTWATPTEQFVYLDDTDTPYGELRFGFEYSAGCVWQLNIELKTGCMPVLPLVETMYDTITWGETGYGFQYHFEVAEASCSKTLQIDQLKLPCLPNPNITVDAVMGAPASELTFEVSCDTDADCIQEWYFNISIPPGAQGPQGDEGPQGGDGPQGPQGHQGDKMAIVAYEDTFIGLACTEMPEPRFQEIMVVELPDYQVASVVEIDPRFLGVIEPNSLRVVSCAANSPVRVGAAIVDNKLKVTTDGYQRVAVVVTVMLSGIRLGHNWRFKEFTKRQAMSNLKFWDGWRSGGLISSSF